MGNTNRERKAMMPEANLLSRSKRMLIALLLSAAAAAALFGMTAAAHAENNCMSGELCVWTGTNYTGSEGYIACPSQPSSVEYFLPEENSAKNRCGGAYIRIGWNELGSTNWKACMAPGGERSAPGRFNRYQRVGGC
jgi:hypothetical protein